MGTIVAMDDEGSSRLCDVAEDAGFDVAGGYLVGDIAAAIILGDRPVVLAEEDGGFWLLAVVGLDGFHHYPEDDLVREAEIDLPDGLVLEWQEFRERAVLARSLPSTADLPRDVEAFLRIATTVEQRLLQADLGFRVVPPGEDPCDRGALMPPTG